MVAQIDAEKLKKFSAAGFVKFDAGKNKEAGIIVYQAALQEGDRGFTVSLRNNGQAKFSPLGARAKSGCDHAAGCALEIF